VALGIVHHKHIVAAVAATIGAKTYLELGVYDGTTLRLVTERARCIAVDVVRRETTKGIRCKFFEMPTDAFFENHGDSIMADAIFVDGDHEFGQVRRDFLNSLSVLNPGGVILLHDTDPTDKRYLKPEGCHDCWRIVDYIDSRFPGLSAVTLPVGRCGLTVVTRRENRRVLKLV
jgi:predicted O-methyltransferase YrrM